MRLVAPTFALSMLAAPAAAQSWEPIGLADPFPPTGTRYCAEGGGERVCLALFCAGAGNGLRLGYVDTTWPMDVSGATVTLNVDASAFENVLGGPDPTSEMDRVGSYPYFVAMGEIASDQAGPLIAALRAGSEVEIAIDSEYVRLGLSGSAREIDRVLDLCGPPVAPERAGVAPETGGEPGAGESATERDVAAEDTPRPTAGGDAPGTDETAGADPIAPEAAETGVVRQQGWQMQGPPIAARWTALAPDPLELVTGTALCFGDTVDDRPLRCLEVKCFGEASDGILWWEDRAAAAGDGPLRLGLAADGAAPEFAELFMALDAPHRIATGPLTPAILAALSDGQRLSLAVAGGVWHVESGGGAAEIARVAGTCSVPGMSPPDPVRPVNSDARDVDPDRAAGVSVPEGGREILLKDETLGTMDPSARAALMEVHAQDLANYEDTFGETVAPVAAELVQLDADRALLFTRLCGQGGWFGPTGCQGNVFFRISDGWKHAFFDGETGVNRISLDFDSSNYGWPVIRNSSGVDWHWQDGGYRPL